MDDCIFCKIKKREIPAPFVYEDDEVMVFPDIHPVKPIHILIVPKEHIEDFFHLTNDHLRSKIVTVVQQMIDKHALISKGYKVIINGGGHQDVAHLHIHLIGPMGAPQK